MITILQITNVSRAFPLHDQQTAADGAIFESVSLSTAEEVSEKKNKANRGPSDSVQDGTLNALSDCIEIGLGHRQFVSPVPSLQRRLNFALNLCHC